jgi:hypothetical protein
MRRACIKIEDLSIHTHGIIIQYLAQLYISEERREYLGRVGGQSHCAWMLRLKNELLKIDEEKEAEN